MVTVVPVPPSHYTKLQLISDTMLVNSEIICTFANETSRAVARKSGLTNRAYQIT